MYVKHRYTEDYLKEVIEQRVFPHAPEEEDAFSLEHIVAGSVIKRNGSDYRADCVIDTNSSGMLVVFTGNIHSDEALLFYHFRFSDIQGIQVKKRISFYHVIVQFIDGRHYVFECAKQDTKERPNQANNLQKLIAIVEDQQLNDMNNDIHKENVTSNRKLEGSYIITLVVFLLAALFSSLKIFPSSMVAMVITVIVAAVAHFIVYSIVSIFLHTRKDRPFVKEFNEVMKEYNEKKDMKRLLDDLTNIKHEPKTKDSKNTFYLTISTALHENDRSEEALASLNQVQTLDEQEMKIVEEQRKVIQGKKE